MKRLPDGRILTKVVEEKTTPKTGIPVGYIRKTFFLKCLNCKKIIITPGFRFNAGCYKFCSFSCSTGGKYNPNYKNGKTIGQSKRDKLRKEIFKERGARCENCGYNKHPSVIEINHILPRKKGGKDIAENIMLLCCNCHQYLTRVGKLPSS